MQFTGLAAGILSNFSFSVVFVVFVATAAVVFIVFIVFVVFVIFDVVVSFSVNWSQLSSGRANLSLAFFFFSRLKGISTFPKTNMGKFSTNPTFN